MGFWLIFQSGIIVEFCYHVTVQRTMTSLRKHKEERMWCSHFMMLCIGRWDRTLRTCVSSCLKLLLQMIINCWCEYGVHWGSFWTLFHIKLWTMWDNVEWGTMEGSGYKVGWVGLAIEKGCGDWKAFKSHYGFVSFSVIAKSSQVVKSSNCLIIIVWKLGFYVYLQINGSVALFKSK